MKRKLVRGVGINDSNYTTQKKEYLLGEDGKKKQIVVWTCPYYRKWSNLLDRCYNQNRQNRQPTYKDCTVCDEWLTFSNFKAWMEQQDWEGKHLDKDLLYPDNKVYSPDTCCFISQALNNFLVESDKLRGEWPLGVCWDKQHLKFRAVCRNPFTKKLTYIGLFSSSDQAHYAWVLCKANFAQILAEQEPNDRVANALRNRYTSLTENKEGF